MKRQWRVRRELLATPDGHQRWDRAYQYLLGWTSPDVADPMTAASERQTAEVEHASSNLRAGVDAATGTGADD